MPSEFEPPPLDAPGFTAHTPAYARFLDSLEMNYERWHDGDGIDLAAADELTDGEWLSAVALLRARPQTWRETEALARLARRGGPVAIDVTADLHRTIDDAYATADARLAALSALNNRGPLPDFDHRLAGQIRKLNRTSDGLTRALALAGQHPTPAVRQALLWSAWNQTDCAPACAALLCRLADAPPTDAAGVDFLQRLDVHNSYFTRKAAFDALCERVGMELDANQG
jgi:hypothetical protein